MTDDAPATPLEAAREHATHAWALFTDNRGLKDTLPDWQASIAPDGSPVLSAQVVGGDPARALSLFASQYYLTLPHPGDLRPQFDTDVPGRTVLVWRRDGVWVELWHPDTAPAAPDPVPVLSAPVPAPADAARRGLGARFTFTRNRRPKETTA